MTTCDDCKGLVSKSLRINPKELSRYFKFGSHLCFLKKILFLNDFLYSKSLSIRMLKDLNNLIDEIKKDEILKRKFIKIIINQKILEQFEENTCYLSKKIKLNKVN